MKHPTEVDLDIFADVEIEGMAPETIQEIHQHLKQCKTCDGYLQFRQLINRSTEARHLETYRQVLETLSLARLMQNDPSLGEDLEKAILDDTLMRTEQATLFNNLLN